MGSDQPVGQPDHHADEGNTLAAWTACGGIIVASVIGALAVVFTSILLGVVAVVVTVGSLLAGAGLAARARSESSREPSRPG